MDFIVEILAELIITPVAPEISVPERASPCVQNQRKDLYHRDLRTGECLHHDRQLED